eukprot:gene20732-27547_t
MLRAQPSGLSINGNRRAVSSTCKSVRCTARTAPQRIVCRSLQHSAPVSESSSPLIERRAVLGFFTAQAAWMILPPPSFAGTPVSPITIQPDLAPDQSKYNPADPVLREAANMLQEGLNAETLELEEATWTKIIDIYGSLDEPWVPDVVGRAWGNRGNARSRQGRLEEALSDYNESIRICPWSGDPVLNSGGKGGRQAQANVSLWEGGSVGLGRFDDAVKYYGKAVELAPSFSFAAANKALAMYQQGQEEQAIRDMRALLRRYPDFPDMRAGLAAALWGQGLEGQAESTWERVDDIRYKDRNWIRKERRWPPKLANSLEALLDLKSLKAV